MNYGVQCVVQTKKARISLFQSDGRSISVVGFDLSFTGKLSREVIRMGGAQADWKEKLLVLNAFNGKSGATFALPVQKRSDSHFMAREL